MYCITLVYYTEASKPINYASSLDYNHSKMLKCIITCNTIFYWECISVISMSEIVSLNSRGKLLVEFGHCIAAENLGPRGSVHVVLQIGTGKTFEEEMFKPTGLRK